MSPVEVLVIFVGGPAAIFAACWLLAVAGSRGSGSQPYKLGTTWESEPLWFVGRPREQVSAHRMAPALEPAKTTAIESGSPTVVGGASGSW